MSERPEPEVDGPSGDVPPGHESAATGPDPDAASTATPGPTTRSTEDPLRGSRASGLWAAVVALVVLLVLLAVFVLQNTQPVEVSYFGWQGEAPLAAALLIAVAAGLLIAVVAGSLRILQLRRRVRRERKR
jgi:uncharacterized integral membrane protein